MGKAHLKDLIRLDWPSFLVRLVIPVHSIFIHFNSATILRIALGTERSDFALQDLQPHLQANQVATGTKVEVVRQCFHYLQKNFIQPCLVPNRNCLAINSTIASAARIFHLILDFEHSKNLDWLLIH